MGRSILQVVVSRLWELLLGGSSIGLILLHHLGKRTYLTLLMWSIYARMVCSSAKSKK